MIKGTFPVEQFEKLETPFYYYDTALLRKTLSTINDECRRRDGYHVHYAVKANANPKVLGIISQAGLGADCVSGGEIKAALAAGFPASKIVYAGVGKSDWEINLALDANIFCFNVESIPELEVINELAVCMECRVIEYDKETCILKGEIVNVSVDEAALTDGKVDLAKVRPIAFDPFNNEYNLVGEVVGKAWGAGRALL